jgi:SNF2 family DNA or RNA helicase
MIATMWFNRSSDHGCKTTLIIAPVALLRQWKAEIETKSVSTINVLIYHGSSRPSKAKELTKYDVVLTTFGTLASEWPDSLSGEAKMKRKKSKKEDDWIVHDSDEGAKKSRRNKHEGLLYSVRNLRKHSTKELTPMEL